MKRPGARVRAIAARLCRAETMARLVDPTLADLQAEYGNAISCNRKWESRRILAQGYLALVQVMAVHGGVRVMAILRESTDEDRRALIRTLAASAMIMMVATVVLAVIPFSNLGSGSRPDAAKLALLLIPQALPLSIPLGLAFGILWALGRATASRRARTSILLLATLASVASFGMLGWLAPTANQAFRVSMIGRPVVKGPNELTLGELRQLLEPGSREPMAIAAPSDRRSLAFTYHRRWALAVAPLVFALFAVALTSRPRWGRVVPSLTACLAIFSYWAVMHSALWLGLDRILSALGAAWAPNAAFLILSAAVTANSCFRIPVTGQTRKFRPWCG